MALMFLAKWVIDLAVPYDFPKEIKEGNTAAGFMIAGIFIAVHLEAKKEGLRGLTKEELPRLLPLLKKTYLLLPLIILIYLVGTSKRSIQYAAAIAIVVTPVQE